MFIHLRTRKMPFGALVFTLRSKVELNWTRATRSVIAQSVQFSKIEKTEHRFGPIFFSSKGRTVLIKIMKYKMGVAALVFAVELQKAPTKCIFVHFWERTGASFKMACMWKGKEVLKNPFLQNLHRDTSLRTQCNIKTV